MQTLPHDAVHTIWSFLSTATICSLQRVCRLWHTAVPRAVSVWRDICSRDFLVSRNVTTRCMGFDVSRRRALGCCGRLVRVSSGRIRLGAGDAVEALYVVESDDYYAATRGGSVLRSRDGVVSVVHSHDRHSVWCVDCCGQYIASGVCGGRGEFFLTTATACFALPFLTTRRSSRHRGMHRGAF